MANINLPMPDELLEAVDHKRGDVPRTVWIRRAIEQALQDGIDHERAQAFFDLVKQTRGGNDGT